MSEEFKSLYDDLYEAYLFAFPLVATEIFGAAHTNTVKAGNKAAPVNQFTKGDSVYKDIFEFIGGTNLDTTYASALLNLKDEPIVVHKPAVEDGRYFSILALNGNGIFIGIIEKDRKGGSGEDDFVFIGPDYSGEIPYGLAPIYAKTNLVSLVLRIRECDDIPNDWADTVNVIQNKITLRPLSQYKNKDYAPADGSYSEANVYNAYQKNIDLTLTDFFARYNRLVVDNPPDPEEIHIAEKYYRYGIGAGKVFSLGEYDDDNAAKLNAIPKDYAQNFSKHFGGQAFGNKWTATIDNSLFPKGEIAVRATLARWGIGANPPQVAIYYSAHTDKNGIALTGEKKFVLRFEKGALPPIHEGGFWSIVPYYTDRLYVRDNELKRYRINERTPLTSGQDGSVEIYLQHEDPGTEKRQNWFPTSKEPYSITLRIYTPKQEAVEISWQPPDITEVDN